MFKLWMVARYLSASHKFLNLTTILAIFGLAIGVGSLVVAMAVVSGYETTFKRSVTEVVGHVILLKRGANIEDRQSLAQKVNEITEDNVVATTPFVYFEAVLAHNKKLSGIVVEGIEPSSVESVLALRDRVSAGDFDLNGQNGVPAVLVGKGLAEKFDIQLGQKIKLVMPVSTQLGSSDFRPRLKTFVVKGVLNFGRHDYDTRYVVTNIKAAQKFANIGDAVTGMRLKLTDEGIAQEMSYRISNQLGYPFWTRSWYDASRNIFEAIKMEKPVLFFILLIIVVAAAFNVSSTLFVSVLRKFSDVSILKAMGASHGFVKNLFVLQGLVIGAIGTVLGVIFGLAACYAFVYGQEVWQIIPPEVYKLDKIGVEVRALDILAIFFASLMICLVATYFPARRGARFSPVEGLRYE